MEKDSKGNGAAWNGAAWNGNDRLFAIKALQGKKVTQETMITAIKARIEENGGK